MVKPVCFVGKISNYFYHGAITIKNEKSRGILNYRIGEELTKKILI